MRIRINSLYRLKLIHVFELMVCIFYTWYFLPISQALFWQYKTIMFMFFLVGVLGLVSLNGIRFELVLLPIVAYMLMFVALVFLNVDDADAHIRISFTFWGTALLYFAALKDEGRVRIGKYLLFLFVITAITSAIGVITDNSAARTITHVDADDELQKNYQMMNIASIYLFQCLVFFVPVLVCLPKIPKIKTFSILLIVAIFAVLVNASFTISLIGFVFALFLSLILRETKISSKRMALLLIIGFSVMVFVLNGSVILEYLGNTIKNEKIAQRMHELNELIYHGNATGDAGTRWELYSVSLQTFFQNPLGVGAHYSYLEYSNGIGYHSKILDDLARFGIFALAFYVVFFFAYYKHLKRAWKRVGYPQIATVVTATYFVFLVLNLGFRSADESIITLFIMPALPLLIESRNAKKALKEG